MFNNIVNAVKGYQRKRQTIRELSRLSTRELNDLGISRCDIYRVANGN